MRYFQPEVDEVTVASTIQNSPEVLLCTATGLVEGPTGPIKLSITLDNCSHRTFIGEEFAQDADLDTDGEEELGVQAFGQDPEEPTVHKRRNLRVQGLQPGAPLVEIIALERKKMCSLPAYHRTSLAEELWLKGLHLADERFYKPSSEIKTVDLLIGADYYWKIVEHGGVTGPGGLAAIPSKFGWLLNGPTKKGSTSGQNHVNQLLVNMVYHTPNKIGPTGPSTTSTPMKIIELSEDEEEAYEAKALWTLEGMGILDSAIKEDDEENKFTEEYQKSSITRKPDGRYVGKLTWKPNKVNMKNHQVLAEGRLASQLRKLRKTPELLRDYHNEIMQFKKEGFIQEMDPNYDGTRIFLPHHPVVKPERTTTKIRPVFDASAKTKYSPSLNDCLDPGPNLTPDILAVLLRFQLHRIAWIADVKKAFFQIELHPDDAETVALLWPEDPFNPTSVQQGYVWKRVTFGMSCSPFILRAVLEFHFRLYERKYPETVQLIRSQLYVDDILGGAPEAKVAERQMREAKIIFEDAKMSLRKWLTNDSETQTLFKANQQEEEGLEGTLGQAITGPGSPKVLGVLWDPEDDCFWFNPTAIVEAARELPSRPTKRQVHSIAARLFDPLGFLAPIVVLIKLLHQKLWVKKVGWDEEIPPEAERDWMRFIDGLEELKRMRVPRWIQVDSGQSNQKVELHVYGDASFDAYGANVYIRIEKEDGEVYTRLLSAKQEWLLFLLAV